MLIAWFFVHKKMKLNLQVKILTKVSLYCLKNLIILSQLGLLLRNRSLKNSFRNFTGHPHRRTWDGNSIKLL